MAVNVLTQIKCS